MEIFTKSAQETKKVGRDLGASIREEKEEFLTIGLTGELGSGKTTFIQGLAEGLGIEVRVISPTFILMRDYKLSEEKGLIEHFYHVDLYRLEKNIKKEVVNLGVTDIWSKKGNVVAIEWADRIADIMPSDTYWVNFEESDKGRKITIKKDP